QGNAKTTEGNQHADRDAQFRYLAAQVTEHAGAGQPVVSVDAKKKELVGAFKNGGREYQPAGEPEQVNVHDFPDKELGKAIPYGIYDVSANTGWVSVGTDHDTSAFAAESGLRVTVAHLPPGTSKWNKIEHRLFSQITLNWRGRPLTSHQVIV